MFSQFKRGRSVPPTPAVSVNFNSAMTSLPAELVSLGATFTRASTKRVWQGSGWTVLSNDQFGTGWTEVDQKYGATFTLSATNLVLKSEGTLADATSYSNVSDISMSAFDAGIAYGDNSVDRQYSNSITVIASIYLFSCFIQMDDGGAPVIGTSTTNGDFIIRCAGKIADAGLTVEHVYGTLYRIWGANATIAVAGSRDSGIFKYTTQSARSFKISGQQLTRTGVNGRSSYIRTTGSSASSANEVLTFPSTGISGFSSSQFSTMIEYSSIYTTTTERYLMAAYRLAGVSGATATDYLEIGLSSSNQAFIRIFSGGSQVLNGSVRATSGIMKHATSITSGLGYNSIKGYLPPARGVMTVTPMPVGCDTFRLGSRMDETLFAGDNNRIYSFKIFTQFLTQTQLNEVTK